MSTLTIDQLTALVAEAAKEKHMSSRVWTSGDETRVYLRRTNAARTEAGYMRFRLEGEKILRKLVITASGAGSRTCQSEAEAVERRYIELRGALKASLAAE